MFKLNKKWLLRMTDLFDLSGKTAIVTGGASGIGKSIAKGLAENGADIAIADIDEPTETKKIVRDEGQDFMSIETDISDQEEVEEMVDKVIAEFGGVDILVNNAGVWRTVPSIEENEEGLDKLLDVDLKGTFYCSKAVANKYMIENGGDIINIISCFAHQATPNAAAYNSAKSGLLGLTQTLAVEWIEHGINVNGISPGVHRTPMTEPPLEQDEFRNHVIDSNPLHSQRDRVGDPDELRGTAVYLASKASSEVNGETITVDGGKLAMW